MNKEKISAADKNKLKAQEDELQELRLNEWVVLSGMENGIVGCHF